MYSELTSFMSYIERLPPDDWLYTVKVCKSVQFLQVFGAIEHYVKEFHCAEVYKARESFRGYFRWDIFSCEVSPASLKAQEI